MQGAVLASRAECQGLCGGLSSVHINALLVICTKYEANHSSYIKLYDTKNIYIKKNILYIADVDLIMYLLVELLGNRLCSCKF